MGYRLSGENAIRFFTQDIVPTPLRGAAIDSNTLIELAGWLKDIVITQAMPGLKHCCSSPDRPRAQG